MSQSTLNGQLFIDEVNVAEPVSGYLLIESDKTLHIDGIEGELYLEMRGRLSSQLKEVASFEIAGATTVLAGEPLKIPFTFVFPMNQMPVYEGENVSFTYRCEAAIKINENDIEKLEKSFIGKVKMWLNKYGAIKVSEHISLGELTGAYQIVPKKQQLRIDSTFMMFFLGSILVFLITLCIIQKFDELILIVAVVLFNVALFLLKKIVVASIGAVSVELLKDGTGFICKIYRTKGFVLSNQSAYYDIVEKVIDRRGTSDTTNTAILFTSNSKKLTELGKNAILKFDYPEKKGWYSMKQGDVSIHWRMNLEGKLSIFPISYHCLFEVKRVED